jgi:methionine-rich copper-binding protein CopC
VTITVRGPNNYSESRTDSTNTSGFVRLRTGISQTGTYTAEVHVTAEDGATASGSSSITVTSAPGNCPPP